MNIKSTLPIWGVFLLSVLAVSCQSSKNRAIKWHYAAQKSDREKKSKRALRRLQKAIKLSPSINNEWELERINLLVKAGRMKKARSLLSRLQKEERLSLIDEIKHLSRLGLIAINLNARDFAVVNLQKAIQLTEETDEVDSLLFSAINNNLGIAYLFNQSVSRKSRKKPAYRNIHIKDFERACKRFELSLHYNRNNCHARYNLSVIRKILNKVPQENNWKGYIPDSIISKISTVKSTCLEEARKKKRHNWIRGSFSDFDNLLFVIDCSYSMNSLADTREGGLRRFDLMRNIVLDIASSVSRNMNIGILSIEGTCGAVPLVATTVETTTPEKIKHCLNSIRPYGSTPLNERLKSIPDFFKNTTGGSAVFLCTDGMDSCGGATGTCEIGKLLYQKGIQLFVFTQLLEKRNNFFEYGTYDCLAKTTGGKLLAFNDKNNIQNKTHYISDSYWNMSISIHEILEGKKYPEFE